MDTSISIIIPAWNEEKTILKTTSYLNKLKLPFKYSELIFIAGGNDNTYNICQEIKLNNFDKILVLKQNPGDFKSGALMKGMMKSKGDVITLIDADVFVAPNLMVEIVKSLKISDVVNCDYIPMMKKGFWYNYHTIFKLNWLKNPNKLSSLIGGATISLRRKLIDEIGIQNFFSKKSTAGVDYYMGQILRQNNKNMRFLKSTRVLMPRPNNIKDFSRDRMRWYSAFFSLHNNNLWLIFTTLVLSASFCLFPPLLSLYIIKNMIKFSERSYPKIKFFFIYFLVEYLINFLIIAIIIGKLTHKIKPIRHFKGKDRYLT